jgi:RNA polymerase sigma-70 factor (ECF subfamily)
MDRASLPNEQQLFNRIAEGDESAFSECYLYYGRLLMPSLIRLLGQRESAEEVVQEVFLKVWLFRDRLVGLNNPKGWLLHVAANTARDWLRKKAREQRRVAEIGRLMDSPEISGEYRTDLQMLRAVVRRAVDSFPPQRRRIYQMSREEGLKPSEIAARMGLSVSTVKNTLLSALHAIREVVEKAGFWTVFLFYFLKR